MAERYPEDQLRAAFKMVQNKDHWKNPINAVVPADTDLDLLRDAVVYYTGSVPEFLHILVGVRVTADGYFIAIGS